MGFLSGITDSLFGGSDDSGIKAQQKANDRSQAYIKEQSGLARTDANRLFGQGDDARNQGINLAMALMGQSLPQQMQMYQDGNARAQQQLMMGQHAYNAAILGQPSNQAPPQAPTQAPTQEPIWKDWPQSVREAVWAASGLPVPGQQSAQPQPTPQQEPIWKSWTPEERRLVLEMSQPYKPTLPTPYTTQLPSFGQQQTPQSQEPMWKSWTPEEQRAVLTAGLSGQKPAQQQALAQMPAAVQISRMMRRF